MDKDKLAARIADALWKRMPKDAVQETFRRDVAINCNAHPDSVRDWMAAKNPPNSVSLLALFEYFGREFEQEVRGEAMPAISAQ